MNNDVDVDAWRRQRDAKVAPLLEPRTPAWLLNETIDEENQIIRFDLVHRWPIDSWSARHYRYEVDVDVLYYRGVTPLSSADRAKLKPEDRFDTRLNHFA